MRGVLRHLGAVQLDTISVLARSHELVAYARLGAVGRKAVEEAYWSGGHAFEYWSHAACILPVEEWPHFAFRRRAYRAAPALEPRACRTSAYEQVIKQLRAEGPLTATDLGGAKNKGEWWDWSATKIAVERALMYGEVVCTERRGWKRVYDLAERADSGRAAARRAGRHRMPAPAGAARGPVASASAPARTSRTTTASRASSSTRWSPTPAWSR